MTGVVLVVDLDNDLGVVQLLLLRRDREPEPRSPAAHKRGQRSKQVWRLTVFFPVMLAVFPDHFTDYAFRMNSSLVSRLERGIFGEPYIDVRQIRQILREKL